MKANWESPPRKGHVFIDVNVGVGGLKSLSLGNHQHSTRVAGPKAGPWTATERFEVDVEQLREALAEYSS